MRKILPHFILLVFIAAGVAGGAGPAAATKPAAVAPTWNSYSLILSRNIFTRDRSSRQRADNGSSIRTRSGGELVLAGVAVQGPDQEAFFEDSASGETTRAAVGQNIGGGTIAAIRLGGVDITTGDSTRTIAVGETLSGRPAELKSLSAPPAASPPASSAPPAAAPGQGSDSGEGEFINAASRPAEESSAGGTATMSIEERMRQQRLQESK